MPRQVVDRHRGHLALFAIVDALSGAAELSGGAGADFDEHQRPAVLGDDVNFSVAGAVAALENCVPSRGELPRGELLADEAETLSVEGDVGRCGSFAIRTPVWREAEACARRSVLHVRQQPPGQPLVRDAARVLAE